MSMSLSNTAADILNRAKQEYASKRSAGRAITYSDYERYKFMLLDAGCYGYESRLAAILHI